MNAESFFARWAKRNAEAKEQQQLTPPAPAPTEENAPPVPTMDDVAQLTADSDFKPFLMRGVDENVRRSALKKLFADPQFNVMDGLDVYIEDYHSFSPLTPAMVAALAHAQALFAPLGLSDPDEAAQAANDKTNAARTDVAAAGDKQAKHDHSADDDPL